MTRGKIKMTLRAILENYNTAFNEFDLQKTKKLKEKTGEIPPNSVIQDQYKNAIQKGKLSYISGLEKITGVSPSEKIRNEGFVIFIKKGWIDALKSLETILKTPLPKSEEVVKEVQNQYDSCDVKGLTKFRKIKRITGIKPSEEVIQRKYESCVKNNWLDTLKDYYKMTKIKPKVSEKVIQEKLKKNFLEMNKINVDSLLKVFKVPLKNEIIQEGYRVSLKKGNIDLFEHIRNLTKIEPEKDVYLSDGISVDSILYLISSKEVKIEKGILMGIIQKNFLEIGSNKKDQETYGDQEKRFWDFSRRIGIKPTEETLKEIYKNNIRRNSSYGRSPSRIYNKFACFLMCSTGVLPEKGVNKAVFKEYKSFYP